MFRLKQIKLNKIKEFFKKLLRILGENPFLASLTFILISLILGSMVFYKYSVLVEEKKLETLIKPPLLEEEILKDVLKIWQDRQKKFDEAGFKEYPNPFIID